LHAIVFYPKLISRKIKFIVSFFLADVIIIR